MQTLLLEKILEFFLFKLSWAIILLEAWIKNKVTTFK